MEKCSPLHIAWAEWKSQKVAACWIYSDAPRHRELLVELIQVWLGGGGVKSMESVEDCSTTTTPTPKLRVWYSELCWVFNTNSVQLIGQVCYSYSILHWMRGTMFDVHVLYSVPAVWLVCVCSVQCEGLLCAVWAMCSVISFDLVFSVRSSVQCSVWGAVCSVRGY